VGLKKTVPIWVVILIVIVSAGSAIGLNNTITKDIRIEFGRVSIQPTEHLKIETIDIEFADAGLHYSLLWFSLFSFRCAASRSNPNL